MPAVLVRVSATSANLGPGFDSLGLALGLHDEVEVRPVAEPGARVSVTGEGADEVDRGEEHLVVRSLRRALHAVGAEQPAGLELVCRNEIPHGRGLGSSAAAVVAGVAAARALVPDRFGDDVALRLASELEGHPDNAAAALLGGLTIAWTDPAGAHAARLQPHPDLAPLVLVPTGRLATHHARSVLPTSVTHADAAANSGRAALLVHALTAEPDLLLAATEDRLHQRQRASAMPRTLELVDALRARGVAAVVSGAGPSVLVLGRRDELDAVRRAAEALAGPQWTSRLPGVDLDGVRVTPL